jgi:hypothetical protein
MFNNGKFDTNFISFNFFFGMEQSTLRNISNCLNTNINTYLETSGGHSSNTYLNVVHFFNTRVDSKSVAVEGSCFPALVSNTCCSNKV